MGRSSMSIYTRLSLIESEYQSGLWRCVRSVRECLSQRISRAILDREAEMLLPAEESRLARIALDVQGVGV